MRTVAGMLGGYTKVSVDGDVEAAAPLMGEMALLGGGRVRVATVCTTSQVQAATAQTDRGSS